MIRRPPRSTQGVSSAASDVYKRQTATMTDATVDVTAVDVTVTVATKAKVGVDAVVTVAEVAEAVILAAAEATTLVAAAAEAAEAPTSTLQITLLSHLWVK